MAKGLRSRVASGVLAALGLVACTSADDALKQHGEKARAAVATMAQMRADLQSRGPVAADEHVTIDGGGWIVNTSVLEANVAVLYDEDLAAPGELGNVEARLVSTTIMSDCAALLAHKTKAWSAREPDRWKDTLTGDEIATTLERCGNLRGALVLRVMDAVAPGGEHAVLETTKADAGVPDAGAKVDAGAVRTKAPARPTAAARVDAGASADAGAPPKPALVDAGPATSDTCGAPGLECVFDGGYQRVEVHVYSFAPLAHRGAFVFEAGSGELVDVSRWRPDYVVSKDLTDALATAFRQAVVKNVTGATISGWVSP